jgi:uncharacterized membrane protein YdjX (TVP38/TMEM64 family)
MEKKRMTTYSESKNRKTGLTNLKTTSLMSPRFESSPSKSRSVNNLSFGFLIAIGLFIMTAFIYMIQTVKSVNFEFKLPSDIQDVIRMKEALSSLLERNYIALLSLFIAMYILKQTFCIPGSVLLNLLAGNLFGIFPGFLLVCFTTTVGASCCYWLSYAVGKNVVKKLFSQKVKTFEQMISSHREELLFYLLFIRVIPATPNWFLNMSSPLVGVPFHLFMISVLFGLMPYNFICVQAGSILGELRSVNDIFDTITVLKLFGVALVSLIPVLIKRMKK